MAKDDPDIVRLAGRYKRSRELVDTCREIAKGNKLDGAEGEVLLLSAWFHDAGGLAACADACASAAVRSGHTSGTATAVASLYFLNRSKREVRLSPRSRAARDWLPIAAAIARAMILRSYAAS